VDDAESGDVLEVAVVASSDPEAELQGSGRGQQILESDAHSLLGLLAFDAAREFGRLDRHRMHRHVADEFIDESLPALPPLLRLGALDAVRQLDNGHYRKTGLDFSIVGFKVFQDLPYGVTLALGGDDHAGIED
jgi:hypothetical protein